MRVNSSKNITPNTGAKKAQKQKSRNKFAPFDDESTSTASTVSHTTGISDLDAILALQSVEPIDSQGKRKNAVMHADAMLDELDQLKVALLSGKQPKMHLVKLKKLIEQQPHYSEDKGLVDLLDQINLRVEVELAKFSLKK